MDFSIRDTLILSWKEFKANFTLFLFLISINFLIQAILPDTTRVTIQGFVVAIVAVVWSFVLIKSVLRVVDGEVIAPTYAYVRDSLPTFRQFFMLLGIGILTGAIYIVGLAVLIVPGLYFIGRLLFSSFSYVDGKTNTVGSAINASWNMTRGAHIWTSMLVFIVIVALVLLGVILFRVGEFVTIPIALLLMGHCYRALEQTAINEQPSKRIIEIIE